jgi:hypothetical protein
MSYLVAFRLLEMAARELGKIDSDQARAILEKLKEPKRDLEDIIW